MKKARLSTLRTNILLSVTSACLTVSLPCPAYAAEISQHAGPVRIFADDTVSALGACKITVLKTYFWRDWMPIVSRPGPDRGSPLHAKVQLSLDNSTGNADTFSFRAVIVDSKGKVYPTTFHVLPNYRVLPEDIDKSYSTLDDKTRKSIDARYNVVWNGELKPGEVRTVEFLGADGPYLPVGDMAHVEITLTDLKGDSIVVRTPDAIIHRTD
jgi:hypothetical protein